jgi:hypothetical protein
MPLGGHLSGTGVTARLKQPTRDSSGASSASPLLGLAAGGVCLAAPVARRAGALLPHRFTLAVSANQGRRWHYPSLWHYSVRSPCLAVSQHHALRSADFPQVVHPRPPDRLKHSTIITKSAPHNDIHPCRPASRQYNEASHPGEASCRRLRTTVVVSKSVSLNPIRQALSQRSSGGD